MWRCETCGCNNSGAFCVRCGHRISTSPANETSINAINVKDILSRKQIKQQAKSSLASQNKSAILLWLTALGFTYGTGLVTGFIFPFTWFLVLPLVSIFVLNITSIGEHYAGVKLYKKEQLQVKDLFVGFLNYGHMLGGTLWWWLWLVLWGCVPIIGVIKYYSYSMTPYILSLHPELSARQALKRSIQITDGYKADLFVMDLSFIGWNLLNILTLGILGVFYVTPYYMTTWAGYYCKLYGRYSVSDNMKNNDTNMQCITENVVDVSEMCFRDHAPKSENSDPAPVLFENAKDSAACNCETRLKTTMGVSQNKPASEVDSHFRRPTSFS